jgi:hypothetical protein
MLTPQSQFDGEDHIAALHSKARDVANAQIELMTFQAESNPEIPAEARETAYRAIAEGTIEAAIERLDQEERCAIALKLLTKIR